MPRPRSAARARDLDEADAGPEAGRLGSAVDVLEHALAVDSATVRMLARARSAGAGRVVLMQAPAGEIGVAALQAMDDASLEQRLERAVDGDRREPRALLGEPAEDVVAPIELGIAAISANTSWRSGVKRMRLAANASVARSIERARRRGL